MNFASGTRLPPDDTSGYYVTAGSRAAAREPNASPILGVRRVLLAQIFEVQFGVPIRLAPPDVVEKPGVKSFSPKH